MIYFLNNILKALLVNIICMKGSDYITKNVISLNNSYNPNQNSATTWTYFRQTTKAAVLLSLCKMSMAMIFYFIYFFACYWIHIFRLFPHFLCRIHLANHILYEFVLRARNRLYPIVWSIAQTFSYQKPIFFMHFVINISKFQNQIQVITGKHTAYNFYLKDKVFLLQTDSLNCYDNNS